MDPEGVDEWLRFGMVSCNPTNSQSESTMPTTAKIKLQQDSGG